MALFKSLLCFILAVSSVYGHGLVFPGSGATPEGACRLSNGKSGWCRPLEKCTSAEAESSVGEDEHTVCGYSSQMAIVCCPVAVDLLVRNTSAPVAIGPVPAPANLGPCGRRSTVRGTHFRRRRRSPELELLLKKLSEDIRPIAGGTDATRMAWPWMALLGIHTTDGEIKWYCDGVLLNPRWVITAAHCIVKGGNPDVIRFGDHDYSTSSDNAAHADYDVNEVLVYADYQLNSVFEGYHDLALVQLKRNVVYSPAVSAVCLPWGDEAQYDLVGKSVSITGWGAKEYLGNHSPILQEANVDVFKTSECDSSYRGLDTYTIKWPKGITKDTYICAGKPEGGVDACQGDSGGPLVYRQNPLAKYVLGGIVSTGYGCGLKEFPGLYVPMSNPTYLQWVKDTAFSG